eukprot:CAMPEP_0202685402 /NCGR_PEP_ID=MMETSP1385-20130828/1145_1 /ASSEMBLY_ACC=CAM_ASM_000861 /TAXON_ID=933848 /ORGANISM="Elphidium margaritaceum" /LENGTH=292 /DNA_ID=CAMNT_0049339737 /DNA_START=69 /DNA_END=947 /DNA_ORIENTATION=+
MLTAFLSCLIGVGLSITYSDYPTSGVTKWNQLKTTFGTNPWSAYFPVEITESKAESKKWVQVMSCESSGGVGNVYIEDDDISVMPIYGQNGQVFGIILAFYDPGETSKTSWYPFVNYTLFDGTVVYGVTAYFRDPSTVCTEGNAYEAEVGDRLWIAQAAVGADTDGGYLKVPLTEDEDGLDQHGFAKGACFWGMGQHYWRYMSVNMDCNEAYPIFLLYNGGVLNAWGIAMAHDDRPNAEAVKKYSKKWENPSGDSLKFFFGKGQMPLCLPKQGEMITMHVYMNNPAYNLCIG